MSEPKLDLDKLERLEQDATPGPWRWADGYKSTYGDAAYTLAGYQDMVILSCDGIFNSPRDCDEELIVSLRNAAPALFAELRAARERIAELESPAKVDPDLLQMAMRIAAGHADASDAWALLEEVERLRKRVAELEGGDQ